MHIAAFFRRAVNAVVGVRFVNGIGVTKADGILECACSDELGSKVGSLTIAEGTNRVKAEERAEERAEEMQMG